jgi:hypothetical protein
VRQAVAEGQLALGGVGDVVLAQVGDRVGQRAVEVELALVGERRIIVVVAITFETEARSNQ